MSDGHSLIHFADYENIVDINRYIDEKFDINIYKNMYDFGRHPTHVRCSDPYWNRYKPDRRFFFSFFYMPEWIELAVEQFNATFQNIKVILYRNINGDEIFDKSLDRMLISKYRIPIFEVEYSKEYPEKFRKYVNLVVHHYFRMLSILETDITDTTKNILKMETPPSDLDVMDLIIKENNTHPGDRYRKLCEYDIDKDTILRLDDLSLVRKVLRDGIMIQQSSRKQTAIFLSLFVAKELRKRPKKNPFKEEDYVKGNKFGNKFHARTYYGKVSKIISPNKMVIDEISYKNKEVYSLLFEPMSEEEYNRIISGSW